MTTFLTKINFPVVDADAQDDALAKIKTQWLQSVDELNLIGQVVLSCQQLTAAHQEFIQASLEHGHRLRLTHLTDIDQIIAYLDQGIFTIAVAVENLYQESANFTTHVPKERLVALVTIDDTSNDQVQRVIKEVQDIISNASNMVHEIYIESKVNIMNDSKEQLVDTMHSCLQSIQAMISKQSAITAVSLYAPDIQSSSALRLIDQHLIVPVVSAAHVQGDQAVVTLGALLGALVITDRPDGYFTTMVCDEQGVALGLVYSTTQSLEEAIKRKKGIYWSRKRGLWEKGLTSGAGQDLLRVEVDCDRDCLRFVVHQHGAGFCHLARRGCWPTVDMGIPALFRTLESRKANAPKGSYTAKLFNDQQMLNAKLLEETRELIEAKDVDEIAWETADLIYFAAVACVKNGVSLTQIESHLDRRTLKVKRRPGLAKAHAVAEAAAIAAASAAAAASSIPASR